MSGVAGGRNYSVSVILKDGGLLKKLEELEKNGLTIGGVPSSKLQQLARATSIGQIGTGQRSGGLFDAVKEIEEKKKNGSVASGVSGGLFNKLENLGVDQIVKLAGISLGIAELVNLTVKSSNILQGTAKLWETSMMLIFKPIGDFVGLALRPVTLALLTQMIIPFERYVSPFFRDYGKIVGEALLNLPGLLLGLGPQIVGALGGIGGSIGNSLTLAGTNLQEAGNGVITNISSALSTIPSLLLGEFTALGTNIFNTLSSIPNAYFGYLSSIGNSIFETLSSIPNAFFGYLSSIGTSLFETLSDIPQTFYTALATIASNTFDTLLSLPGTIGAVFTGLASSLSDTLSGIPKLIYNAIIGWIQSLIGGGGSGGGGGSTSPTATAVTGGSRSRTMIQAVADTL